MCQIFETMLELLVFYRVGLKTFNDFRVARTSPHFEWLVLSACYLPPTLNDLHFLHVISRLLWMTCTSCMLSPPHFEWLVLLACYLPLTLNDLYFLHVISPSLWMTCTSCMLFPLTWNDSHFWHVISSHFEWLVLLACWFPLTLNDLYFLHVISAHFEWLVLLACYFLSLCMPCTSGMFGEFELVMNKWAKKSLRLLKIRKKINYLFNIYSTIQIIFKNIL